MSTMTQVAQNETVRTIYRAVSQSLLLSASQQIRNMARIGGNLMQKTRCAYYRRTDTPCNRRVPGSGCPAQEAGNRGHAILGTSADCCAVYPGDLAVALAAFDAEILISGPQSARRMPVTAFFCDPASTPEIETILAPGEIITGVALPLADAGSAYVKYRDRSSFSFALASAAAVVNRADGRLRLALGGVSTVPWRCRVAEARLAGKTLDPAAVREAARAELAAARPLAENGFKIDLAIEALCEATAQAIKEAPQ